MEYLVYIISDRKKKSNGHFSTGQSFSLRWFTPTTEVDLCGHATLATSHVLFNEVGSSSLIISHIPVCHCR